MHKILLSILVDFKNDNNSFKNWGTDTGLYNTLVYQIRILKYKTKCYLISVLIDQKDILI